jgi:hypothetical protein
VSEEPGTSKPDALVGPESSRPFWLPVWEFAVHAIVGTLIFAIIAGFAIALDFGIVFLRSEKIDETIIIGLKIGDYALFAVDFLLFLTFLIRTIARTYKQL